jgi:hypothetical protein
MIRQAGAAQDIRQRLQRREPRMHDLTSWPSRRCQIPRPSSPFSEAMVGVRAVHDRSVDRRGPPRKAGADRPGLPPRGVRLPSAGACCIRTRQSDFRRASAPPRGAPDEDAAHPRLPTRHPARPTQAARTLRRRRRPLAGRLRHLVRPSTSTAPRSCCGCSCSAGSCTAHLARLSAHRRHRRVACEHRRHHSRPAETARVAGTTVSERRRST